MSDNESSKSSCTIITRAKSTGTLSTQSFPPLEEDVVSNVAGRGKKDYFVSPNQLNKKENTCLPQRQQH